MLNTIAFAACPTLTLPPLILNLLTQDDMSANPAFQPAILAAIKGFQQGWPHFWHRLQQETFLADADLDPQKPWEADMVFVGNAASHAINRQYRHKDAATDVITFTLYADDPNRQVLAQLPMHHLGSVLVNVDWALQETGITLEALQFDTKTVVRGNLTPSGTFIMYILERMIHGCLHLLGVTHDTDIDYNRVVEIQRYVLNAVHLR
jgi:ssRNA-specific RNase YbeY (16S rRNA maturation enzyme)